MIGRHRVRFTKFSLVGAFTFVLGFVLLYVGVQWLNMSAGWAYLAQGIISVEVNFALNRRFTFRDRRVGWWRSFFKWNTTKALTIPLNQGIYMVLMHWGVQYLIANVLTDGIFSVINYMLAHLWAFAYKAEYHRETPPSLPSKLPFTGLYPTVSVIVPVKNSQRTIVGLVKSLLAQDFTGRYEILLVGDVNDSTWQPIEGLLANEAKLRHIEVRASGPGRDANAKRNAGLELATGEVMALTDSDMVMPRNWIRRGTEEMRSGWHCVAGGMVSEHQTFWGRYVDSNVLGGKTPRIAKPYVSTEANFGGRGHKPAITANVFFSRQLLRDVGGFDGNMRFTYEDYEWFWRVANGGYPTILTPELNARHHHRQGLTDLAREYLRGGRGCVDFMVRHPHSLLARRRFRHLQLLLVAELAVLASLVAAAVTQQPMYLFVVGAALAIGVGLGLLEATVTRSLEALAYPLLTLLFGMAFGIGMSQGLVVYGFRPDLQCFQQHAAEILQSYPELSKEPF